MSHTMHNMSYIYFFFNDTSTTEIYTLSLHDALPICGRTEDAENILNEAVPYLRGRECAVEGKAEFAPFTIKTARDLFEIKNERDLIYARDVALLSVHGFNLPTDKVSSDWLSAHVSASEVR